jgi:hypothetical protein
VRYPVFSMAVEGVFRLCIAMYVVICAIECSMLFYFIITAVTCSIIERNKITHWIAAEYTLYFSSCMAISFVINSFPVANIAMYFYFFDIYVCVCAYSQEYKFGDVHLLSFHPL